MAQKRTRRTKAQIEADKLKKQQLVKTESIGLGDTIEKITTVTGIKKLVKFIAGEDCGCDERKEKLNKLFPYKKVECLTEQEYNTLQEIIGDGVVQLRPSEQQKLLTIYNRIFNTKQEPTTCSDCWRQFISQFKDVMKTYEDGQSNED